MFVRINVKNDFNPVSPDNRDYRERNCATGENSLRSK